MARFFVWQRVRLVRARRPENVGLTGRIVEFRYTPIGTVCANGRASSIEGDCVVLYDGDSNCCVEHTSRIEPILPSGHQPAELTVEELLPFLKTREVSDVAV